ncbi:enolase C-terminal domain-like protein [Cellulomonas sp. 73-92]|uniref:enolase C-terminal domain-like protein n=1 Tax=Cellulomonas sp. 73-92 TaxID=1895740 RepID=UPI000A4CAADE|nr:enolase C-terminal domain-like protein [Cellulomonas sp. 73-92]
MPVPITGVDVAAFRVPTPEPEADGTATWGATTLVVVHVRAADRTGLGWSYADPAAAGLVARTLAPVVVGRDVMDVPALNEAMRRELRNVGLPGIGATAVSALDIGLWDLKARCCELPLVSLLGRAAPDVPVYGSGGFTSETGGRLREDVIGWVEHDGIPRVKIKIGESWGAAVDRDLARAAIARQAAGDEAELYVDANGGYRPGQARRVEAALRDLGVSWFEEPVSSDDLAGMAAVRAASRADVAAGEYCWTLPSVAHLLDAGAVDCLQADVTRCGGITVWREAAALAVGHGLQISAHGAPQLSAHVAACVPNARHIEWFADHVRIESLLFDGVLRPSHGSLRPDLERPGHGLTLRTGDAQRYEI